jgi:GNAT superfamily N-acetyltransferase
MYTSQYNAFSQATITDLPNILQTVHDAYSVYISLLRCDPPTFKEPFDEHINNGNLWVMRGVNGKINALTVLTSKQNHMLIQAMAVNPEMQGHGLGMALLDFAEHKAAESNIAELRLYTNELMTRNIKIYTKWGFRPIYREWYDWGARLHMSKYIRTRIKRPQRAVALVQA